MISVLARLFFFFFWFSPFFVVMELFAWSHHIFVILYAMFFWDLGAGTLFDCVISPMSP